MALTLTVLGSGGPVANPRRASSGYLIAVDGAPRILVDAGGGVYERLGRAGADLSALELVLLTHTHVDHTGGLAAVVFSLYMNERRRPLALVGPAGRDIHPGCGRFSELLFARDGAWSYLNTFVGFGIEAREVASDAANTGVRDVPLDATGLAALGVRVRSAAVPHGMMPAVAYRVERYGVSLTFSGDVSEAAPGLIALARETDLLVHDLALPERDLPHGDLHAKPSAVGRVAREAGARALLATHFMPPIEPELTDALAIVRGQYTGPLYAARDLAVFDVDANGARERVSSHLRDRT